MRNPVSPDSPRSNLPGRHFRRRRAGALLALLLLGAAVAAGGCSNGSGNGTDAPGVIVLGFDGLDHELTQQLMSEGKLPNFSRLAAQGLFAPLGTSVPPQSPVAWSNFITGTGPQGHGIYDFVHRDPKTMLPYLSTSRTEPASLVLPVGPYRFPLRSGGTVLLRQGEAFWEVLEEHGVPATIIRMPANYPPSGTASREVSGMGTPDVLGTYGTFSFYTTDGEAFAEEDVSGGKVYDVELAGNTIHASLYGPRNDFRADGRKLEIPFAVHLDPDLAVAKLSIGDEEVLLREGEWSAWVPVNFPVLPLSGLPGMCRFYAKQIRPTFQLYVTPINFDPLDPAAPISTPQGYAGKLATATGRFYTQGMPEDTKAITEGVLNTDEFLEQAKISRDEHIAQYRHVLSEFSGGLLFYYFGSADQISHIMWRPTDPQHPAYDPETDARYRDVLEGVYRILDDVTGYTMEHMPPGTLLVVMSDHGFASWRRVFHLNTWLKDNGYLSVAAGGRKATGAFFPGVDWSRTRAYGLGLNALYINLRGRERNGIVEPAQRERLMGEIAAKLLATVDPDTGAPAITKVYRREQIYPNGRFPDIAPDLVVGYAKGTRGSNESALGEIPAAVFEDNHDAWSADHCMDHETVPGILLANRPLKKPAPSLENLASALLAEFGVDEFPRSGR